MKNKFTSMSFLLVIFVCGCIGIKPLEVRGDIFNENLHESYDSYDKTMSLDRNSLQFENTKEVKNCSDYLKTSVNNQTNEGVNNKIVAQEYVICDSVKIIKESKIISDYNFSPELYGKELFERLDLRSFRSSIKRRLDDDNFTLSQLGSFNPNVEKYSVSVDQEDRFFKIEIVARIDVDGDRKEDWLLWVTDEIKTGNYRNYKVLIVKSPSSVGFLQASELK